MLAEIQVQQNGDGFLKAVLVSQVIMIEVDGSDLMAQ